jgi:hypothetical protein
MTAPIRNAAASGRSRGRWLEGFKRKNTEEVSWDAAKAVAAELESAASRNGQVQRAAYCGSYLSCDKPYYRGSGDQYISLRTG